MISILVDHNMEGRAVILWGTLVTEEWLDILPLKLVMFKDVGLPFDSSDRFIWRFAQKHGMILLTDNRNMKGKDSLEQTIREETTAGSLPVVTIGNPDRLTESTYREQCVTRLVEIFVDLKNYLGIGRLFIP